MNIRQKMKLKFASIVILAVLAGFISYPKIAFFVPGASNISDKLKINLGLDLQGGIHLEYKADISGLEGGKTDEAIQAAQDVIERRINAFGVAEPVVQTAKSGNDYRIIVELPGIKDIEQAKNQIKETPFLEFKEEGDGTTPEIASFFAKANEETKKKAQEILQKALKGENFEELAKANSQDPGSKDSGGDLGFAKKGTFVPEFDKVLFEENLSPGMIYPELVETQYGWHIIKLIESEGEGEEKEVHSQHILFEKQSTDSIPELNYVSTNLTGKNLKDAQVVFAGQGIGEPQVSLKFDDEGKKLFADLTKKNLDKTIAIFLDGRIISAPTVQAEITDGEAVITGNFSTEEAKELAGRLNEGALPVPLSLISQQSVEATLGAKSLEQSVFAGLIGIVAVIVFMLLNYRFLGFIASLALIIYSVLMVSIFKLSSFTPFSITLTLSGIAGFILSVGMAVDANILIFERTKEEIARGRNLKGALEEGFRRAWTSIRDGNVSSIITSLILIIFGTSFVKGFAVTLLIGVLVSMFTAITITRTLLKFLVGEWAEKRLGIVVNVKLKNQTVK